MRRFSFRSHGIGVRKSAIFEHEEIMAMFDDLSEFEDLVPDSPADIGSPAG